MKTYNLGDGITAQLIKQQNGYKVVIQFPDFHWTTYHKTKLEALEEILSYCET